MNDKMSVFGNRALIGQTDHAINSSHDGTWALITGEYLLCSSHVSSAMYLSASYCLVGLAGIVLGVIVCVMENRAATVNPHKCQMKQINQKAHA